LFRIPFLYPVLLERPGEPTLKDRAFLYGPSAISKPTTGTSR